MCIILFNPINDSIGIRIAILSCRHVTFQCIIDTYRVLLTMSIYDGGEIVYNLLCKAAVSPCLSVCLSVCMSACLSVCLSVSLCLSVCTPPFYRHDRRTATKSFIGLNKIIHTKCYLLDHHMQNNICTE